MRIANMDCGPSYDNKSNPFKKQNYFKNETWDWNESATYHNSWNLVPCTFWDKASGGFADLWFVHYA